MRASLSRSKREGPFRPVGFDERRRRRTWEGPPWGRNLGKRSPKERSAVPGASQWRRHSSSQRSGGCDLTVSAQGGGPAPASKTTRAWGLAVEDHNPRGLVVLCPDNSPLQPATTFQNEEQRNQMTVTKEEIEAARTPAGGWTREQLAAWGVPWPPPKGWKQNLIDAHAKMIAEARAI